MTSYTFEMLTADRDYFVRPNGNDANDGLADTPARAFKTLQRATFVALGLFFNGFTARINVADGTYDTLSPNKGLRVFGPYVGGRNGGYILYLGNLINPQKCIINSSDYSGFYASNCYIETYGFSVGSSVRDGLVAVTAGGIGYGNMHFRNSRFTVRTDYQSYSYMFTDCTLNATALTGGVFYSKNGSVAELFDRTVTIIGNPTMPSFAQTDFGKIETAGMKFVGSVQGYRYLASGPIMTHTNPTNQDYFPGTMPGIVYPGGAYT